MAVYRSGAVQVEGLDELRRSLRRGSKEFPKEFAAINKTAAGVVARKAVNRVPRRSGALAASIRPLGSQREGTVAAGKAKVPYAGPIHWGWRKRNIEPQPFLVDALHDSADEVLVIWHRATDRFLDRVWTSIH